MHLGRTIEKFLKVSGMSPTRFGREAARDPRLVYDIRRGRDVRTRLAKRIFAYIEGKSA